jgi:uncharacterized protein YndB with AHSA1/START domain
MQMPQRSIRKEIVVNASVNQVWDAWTTPKGAMTFFAPAANIELAQGGAYELRFDLDAPQGSQGSEGMTILSYLPKEMLSFEWNAPPQYPAVRGQRTWVVVQLLPQNQHRVRVRLTHLGWRRGVEWDQAYHYFQRAWTLVLGRLQHRFAKGPIDWSNPYTPPPTVTYDAT